MMRLNRYFKGGVYAGRLCLSLLSLAAIGANAAEVAIDVGHSLNRPGVISAGGKTEWELNRRLAETVAGLLNETGIGYRLIGADGRMEILTERTRLAAEDSLFVSLHHDSVQPARLAEVERYSGYSLFVSRRNPKLDASLACARKLADRLREAGFTPSLYHAEPIQGENRPFADRDRGIHYYDGLAVLRSAHQPAVLVEAGVAANPQDEIRAAGETGRARTAKALAQGIADCLHMPVTPARPAKAFGQ